MSILQWASLGTFALYLVAFFAGSAMAARAAHRSVWLFGGAKGRDRLAAAGFRLGFALPLVGSLLFAAFPSLAALDPLWLPGLEHAALPGHFLTISGAMLAFAAQVSMGAAWRVGVSEDAVGAFVTDGLHGMSRNPTFVGQALLLVGVALSIPSLPAIAGALLFIASAHVQIRSEEHALRRHYSLAYEEYFNRVPRWLGWPMS